MVFVCKQTDTQPFLNKIKKPFCLQKKLFASMKRPYSIWNTKWDNFWWFSSIVNTCKCKPKGIETRNEMAKARGSIKNAPYRVIWQWLRKTIHRYRSEAMMMIMKETMKTSVVGADREILQSQSVPFPQGQYLLRASMAERGMVPAKAKSVTAKWKISRFRGVRT